MSRKLNIAALSLDELLVLRGEVDALISTRAAAEMVQLEAKIATLKAFAVKHKPAAPSTKPKPSVRASTRKRKRGGKAPIKFRDPKTGNTWSGRGLTPVWLRNHEAAGKKRQKFAVA